MDKEYGNIDIRNLTALDNISFNSCGVIEIYDSYNIIV